MKKKQTQAETGETERDNLISRHSQKMQGKDKQLDRYLTSNRSEYVTESTIRESEVQEVLIIKQETDHRQEVEDEKYSRFTCCVCIQMSMGIKLIALFILIDEVNQIYNIYLWLTKDNETTKDKIATWIFAFITGSLQIFMIPAILIFVRFLWVGDNPITRKLLPRACLYMAINQMIRIIIFIIAFIANIHMHGYDSLVIKYLLFAEKIILFFGYIYNIGILNRYVHLKEEEEDKIRRSKNRLQKGFTNDSLYRDSSKMSE